MSRPMNPHTPLLISLLAVLLGGCPPSDNPPSLGSIAITPSAPSLVAGTELQLVATGTYTNNTTANVSAEASWTSSNPAVVTVDSASARGRLRGVAAGTAEISATVGGVTGRVTVTITAAELVSLAITPAAPSLPLGTRLQLVATGTFSNNTTQDLTTQVSWLSDAPDVATINNNNGPQKGLVQALQPGAARIFVSLDNLSGSTTLTVTPALLRSIGVTPTAPSLPLGARQRFTATGTYSDNTTLDLTTQVTWSSSAPSIAAVSNAAGSQGQATTLTIGQTTLTATFTDPTGATTPQGPVSGSTSLAVTAAALRSIDITPPTATLARDTTRAFVAMGTYSDNTTQDLTTRVTWSSSAPSVAAISNALGSQGLATALAPGQTTLTATLTDTLGTIRSNATLTVSAATLRAIGITPTSPTLPLGTTQNFVATGTYSDNTTQDLTTRVTWSSSAPAIATVANAPGTQGLATARAMGQATVLATFNGVTGSTLLTVSAAVLASISITPASPSVILGLSQPLGATGLYTDGSTRDLTLQVTWSSSDPSIATISNASGSQGRVTGVAGGQTPIVATLGTVSGTATLTVRPLSLRSISISPPMAFIPRGTTQAFVAMGTYSDNTVQDLTPYVAWSAGSATIAAISNAPGSEGLATGLNVGQTPITAALGSVSASVPLVVTPAVLRTLSITPGNASLPLDLSQPFIAVGLYSDNTTQDLTAQVSWSSSDPSVAAISNAPGSRGLTVALTPGQTLIAATLGSDRAITVLTVTSARLDSLRIAPDTATIPRGGSQAFRATGRFDDGSMRDLTAEVTWTSDDTSRAAISNVPGSEGLARNTDGPGTARISARLGTLRAEATLVISPSPLRSIAITPVSPSLPRNITLRLTATGTLQDGSTVDLTRTATWQSTSPSVAFVSNALPGYTTDPGEVRSFTAGQTIITASHDGVTGSTPLTVTTARLAALRITPANASVPMGVSRQFTAMGIYDDGTSRDLTADVFWSSSAPSVADVYSGLYAGLIPGRVVGVSVGQTTLSASHEALTANTALTVTGARLVDLAITPDRTTITRGSLQQFSATGTFDDGTVLDLTDQAFWDTGDFNVAPPRFVATSSRTYSYGLFVGLDLGTTFIRATLLSGLRSAVTTLTVSEPPPIAITITPRAATVSEGAEHQFIATGIYADGTSRDISRLVTWTSNNFDIAYGANLTGRFFARTAGQTTISASLGNLTGSALLAVTEARLVSIAITPAMPSIPLGRLQSLQAIGTFSDGRTQDVTLQVTWTAADPRIAARDIYSVSAFVARGVGQTTISATYGIVTGTTPLTVTAAGPVGLSLSQPLALDRLALNDAIRVQAAVDYSDGTRLNVTDQATWTSSDPRVVEIRSGTRPGERVLASVTPGRVQITVTHDGFTVNDEIEVFPFTIQGIRISHLPTPSPPGLAVLALAEIQWSNGAIFQTDGHVAWSSSDPGVASILDDLSSGRSLGFITPLTPGQTLITVRSLTNPVSASALFTVQ